MSEGNQPRRGLQLDKVVLLGRTFEEYLRFFGLNEKTARHMEILDVAAGVSSFCAEANGRGWSVTAFDRIYAWSPEAIAEQCGRDLKTVVGSIGAAGTYRWDFYQSPERMGEFRERACQQFLADYRVHRGSRYVAGELPLLPFGEGKFGVSLVSYLLFVYEAQFTYEFHRDCVRELLRVTREEVRIYPTVTFAARPSRWLAQLREDPLMEAFQFRDVATDFEFLHGSNSYLAIRRR
jgi:hypothetical protein